MDEYIKKETLIGSIESLDWYSVYRGKLTAGATSKNALYKAGEIYLAIDNIPTADVAPVRHGSIIETIEDGHMKRVFSCCGTDFTKMTCWMAANYCPNCGAKMDGGAD